jgi:hypothetical protein
LFSDDLSFSLSRKQKIPHIFWFSSNPRSPLAIFMNALQQAEFSASHFNGYGSTQRIKKRKWKSWVRVESGVTDIHVLLGTGSTQVNDRDMTDIAESVLIKVNEQEEALPFQTNRVPSIPCVRVGSGVTDINVLGTGSTQVNDRDMTDIAESVLQTKRVPSIPFQRGFQHVFASTRTTSSLRVQAAHRATVEYGSPLNKSAKRRD